MKIVINDGYGGFGLSPLAIRRIAERQGVKCYFFTGGAGEPYTPITIEEAEKDLFWSAFNTDDMEVIKIACSAGDRWQK